MGFVTGVVEPLDPDDQQQVAVYIPTVPNPTSGMLAFVPRDEIIESDITVQDAMKAVFSGGIVLPESLWYRSLKLPSDVQAELEAKTALDTASKASSRGRG